MRSDPPTGDELTRLLVSMKRNILEQVAREAAAASRKRSTHRVIGLSLGVVLLAGAGAGAAFALGVVPTSTMVAASTPTPSHTPERPELEDFAVEPAPSPSDPPAPTATGPLDLVTAYGLCVDAVGDGVRENGGEFDVVPYEEAEVVDRADGRIYVWAEYTDPTKAPEMSNVGAAHCIIGGSADAPEWIAFSQAHRGYREQYPPDEPIDNYTD